MKHIGIIELCHITHYIYLNTVSKILLNKGYTITIYTLQPIAENIDLPKNSKVNIIVKRRNQNVLSFLLEILWSNSCDVFIITTLQMYYLSFLIFLLLLKKPYYVTTHNINLWFSKFEISKQWKKVVEQLCLKIILMKARGVNVLSENMKRYLRNKFHYRRVINIFPFLVYDEKNTFTNINNKIKLTVPGTIDPLRRDYELLLRVLNRLVNNSKAIDRLIIELLGYPNHIKAKKIINEFNKLNKKGLEVIYYDRFVRKEVYETQLSSSDFILGIVNTTNIKKEKYGVTKDTGLNYAMIQSGIPGIFPSEFKNFKQLKESYLAP